MPIALTRMFASLTVFAYLSVGLMGMRIISPEIVTTEISTTYLNYFSKTKFNQPESLEITPPKMVFQEINIKVEKEKIKKISKKKEKVEKNIIVSRNEIEKFTLPFESAVELSPVMIESRLPENLTSLLSNEVIPQVELSSAPTVVDELNTTLGSEEGIEELAVEELVAFDYSAVKKDVKDGKIGLVTQMDTQNETQKVVTTTKVLNSPIISKSEAVQDISKKLTIQEEKLSEKLPKKSQENPSRNYENRIAVNVIGTDFLSSQKELGFEIRPQDNTSEAFSDYNSGEVVIDEVLNSPKMNRTVNIVKRGFTPTNTDLILEEGVSEMTIPMIKEEVFHDLLSPYGPSRRLGVVIVELDENTESVDIDVPHFKTVKLDDEMKTVSGDEYSYLMYVGVKAGNALLSYRDTHGESVSKIIHVHENELTFDSNFYEDVTDEKVVLVEEDVLSKEKAPLILNASQVNHFANQKTVAKVNQHTFKTDYNKTSLGGRKYLELNHLDEPIFVGFKDVNKLVIPSENFMRSILSQFKKQNLANRCLIQVNLGKKAISVETATESVGQSLETKIQILDEDGRFYDSLSTKSEKIIISGDNHGDTEDGGDSKINLKITFKDSSVQYLSSYCSPNTYLVEQL